MKNNPAFEKILNKLKSTKEISFWTGAGISFNSGIPFVKYIIQSVIRVLSDNDQIAVEYFEKYKKRSLPFEVFMQTVIQLSNDDQILEIFERGEPNKTQDFIAKLCAAGKVKEIFTTNFDMLMEKSLTENNLIFGENFSTYDDELTFKKGIQQIEHANKSIKLFKVHGSIDNKKSIRTSIDTIAKQSWMKERSKVIKHAFGNISDRVLIVLGYSFSDVFDINPAIEAIKNESGQTIYIIIHDDNTSHPLVFNFDNFGFNKVNLSKFKGNFIQIKTENFLNFFAEISGIKIMDYKKRNLVWENKVTKWSNRLLPSQKEFILSQLNFIIRDNEGALKWNDYALAKAKEFLYPKNEIDILLQKISILHQEGGNENITRGKEIAREALAKAISLRYFSGIARALDLSALITMYNEDNFLRAKNLYLSSLKIKEKINDVKGQAIGWLSISSCLRHEQKMEEAIKACEKSISIRNQIGDIAGLSKCYQGLGNIYLELKEYKIASRKYQRFETLTMKIGDTWSNATANYGLAEVNYLLGSSRNLTNALNYCDRCLEVRSINRNREYANAKYLKGKILYKLGFISDAKKHHDEAYLLRCEMPNKSDLADSLFDIGTIEIDEKKYTTGFEKLNYAIDIYISKAYTNQVLQIEKYLLESISKLNVDVVENADEALLKIRNYLKTKITTRIMSSLD